LFAGGSEKVRMANVVVIRLLTVPLINYSGQFMAPKVGINNIITLYVLPYGNCEVSVKQEEEALKRKQPQSN
jgi:hypothetical protein